MASDRTWHSGPAGFDYSRSSQRGFVLVEVERDGIRDWQVMNAGPSNSIHLFVYLPSLSCLKLSGMAS